MAEDPSWGDTHRALLQALIAHGTLTLTTTRPILSTILSKVRRTTIQPNDITEIDFTAYMNKLSTAVAAFDYEVRSTKHQVTGETLYAFMNTSSDGLTQAATWCNADEIAFVKRVIDGMFTGAMNSRRNEVCGITGTGALQLCKPRDGSGNTQTQAGREGGVTQGGGGGSQGQLTMGNAEQVLKGLVAQGWFEYSEAGYYSLSPRALMELRGWLIETYNELDSDDEDQGRAHGDRVKLCQACRDIVTVGQRCADKDCPIRLHDFCAEKFFTVQQSTACSKCKKDWKDHGWVGERAVLGNKSGRTNGANATGRRSTGQATQQSSRRSRNTQVQQEDEDEDEQE